MSDQMQRHMLTVLICSAHEASVMTVSADLNNKYQTVCWHSINTIYDDDDDDEDDNGDEIDDASSTKINR